MIYFPGAEEATNLKQLLQIARSGGIFFDRTYHDKEYIALQCHSARRSFFDLLEIATTYFPETTKEELAHLLIYSGEYTCFLCTDIKKIVFKGNNSMMHFKGSNCYNSVFALSTTKGIDDISFADILELANNYDKNLKNIDINGNE